MEIRAFLTTTVFLPLSKLPLLGITSSCINPFTCHFIINKISFTQSAPHFYFLCLFVKCEFIFTKQYIENFGDNNESVGRKHEVTLILKCLKDNHDFQILHTVHKDTKSQRSP